LVHGLNRALLKLIYAGSLLEESLEQINTNLGYSGRTFLPKKLGILMTAVSCFCNRTKFRKKLQKKLATKRTRQKPQ